jgi:hypothetical protein
MPPVTHSLLNRVEPWLLGVPFLFAVLFAVYVAPRIGSSKGLSREEAR